MKTASRFLARPDAGSGITMMLDGAPVTAPPGDTVAAAVLAHSGAAFRRTEKDTPRAAYCIMGVCLRSTVSRTVRAA